MSELAVIWPLIVAHWPFFAYAFAFAFIGEVAKRHIFTPSNVAGMETEARKWWNRKGANRAVAVLILALARTPFEYHPAIAGLLLGLVPGIPLSAGVHYGVQSMVYCASSGVLSLSLYAIVHAFLRFYVPAKSPQHPQLQQPRRHRKREYNDAEVHPTRTRARGWLRNHSLGGHARSFHDA